MYHLRMGGRAPGPPEGEVSVDNEYSRGYAQAVEDLGPPILVVVRRRGTVVLKIHMTDAIWEAMYEVWRNWCGHDEATR